MERQISSDPFTPANWIEPKRSGKTEVTNPLNSEEMKKQKSLAEEEKDREATLMLLGSALDDLAVLTDKAEIYKLLKEPVKEFKRPGKIETQKDLEDYLKQKGAKDLTVGDKTTAIKDDLKQALLKEREYTEKEIMEINKKKSVLSRLDAVLKLVTEMEIGMGLNAEQALELLNQVITKEVMLYLQKIFQARYELIFSKQEEYRRLTDRRVINNQI